MTSITKKIFKEDKKEMSCYNLYFIVVVGTSSSKTPEWRPFTTPSQSLSNSSFGGTIKLNNDEKAVAAEVDAPQ